MYLLIKARRMRLDVWDVDHAEAQADTPMEAKQRRMKAAPLYLASRIEKGEDLPQVEVRSNGEEGGKESNRLAVSVVDLVIEELNDDLMEELQGMMMG